MNTYVHTANLRIILFEKVFLLLFIKFHRKLGVMGVIKAHKFLSSSQNSNCPGVTQDSFRSSPYILICMFTNHDVFKADLLLLYHIAFLGKLFRHGCLAIFKTLDFAERNRWFGGVPGTHGDQPVTFSTYYYGLFKS